MSGGKGPSRRIFRPVRPVNDPITYAEIEDAIVGPLERRIESERMRKLAKLNEAERARLEGWMKRRRHDGLDYEQHVLPMLRRLGRHLLLEVDWSDHPPSWTQAWHITELPVVGFVVDTTAYDPELGWWTREVARAPCIRKAVEALIGDLADQLDDEMREMGVRRRWAMVLHAHRSVDVEAIEARLW